MVEVSRDGRRVYVTNSLYRAWDEQFYLNYRKFRSFNSSHAPSNPGNKDPAVTPMKASSLKTIDNWALAAGPLSPPNKPPPFPHPYPTPFP